MRAVFAVFLLLLALPAAAQDRPEPLPFKPRYHGVSLDEWVGASIAGAAGISLFLVPPRRDGDVWHNDVDDGVRSALRLSTPGLQASASLLSDGLVLAALGWEAFDAVVLAGVVHGSRETAATLVFMDLEAHAFAATLQELSIAVASRERPWGTTCGAPGGPSAEVCANDPSRFRSFFSGHVTHAFTAAALTCMHHANLPLLGGNAEMMPCLATMGVATLTGALRILSDSHYLSDVLTGAAIGSLAGILLPWLLHYGVSERGATGGGVSVVVVPFGLGAGLIGLF